MITQGQAALLGQNIRSWIALAFVGTFALAMALMIWQTASGDNPIANAFAATVAQSTAL